MQSVSSEGDDPSEEMIIGRLEFTETGMTVVGRDVPAGTTGKPFARKEDGRRSIISSLLLSASAGR